MSWSAKGFPPLTLNSLLNINIDIKVTFLFKIFYCSRTHSQLSQFIHELRKSPYGENTKVVALGSRQVACYVEAVFVNLI